MWTPALGRKPLHHLPKMEGDTAIRIKFDYKCFPVWIYSENNEGKIKELPNGKKYVYSEKAKRWIKLEDCDMSHIKAAVVYWNEEGKYYGPLSPEVRKWMLESKNYYLEYYVINRSEGGKINMSYQAPVFNLEY